MIKERGWRMDEQSEKLEIYNKQNMKRNQLGMQNTVVEKYTRRNQQ